MEELVASRMVHGVLDLTTTEVADYVVGGVMACGDARFEATVNAGVPLVISTGALDMVQPSQDQSPIAYFCAAVKLVQLFGNTTLPG